MATFELGTFSVGTLIGMVLGAFIGHALAIRRGKFQVKHNAAIELKKTFSRTIVNINNGENPSIMVSASFHKQHETALEYSAYLKGQKLTGFNQALNAYVNWFKIMCNRDAAETMYGDNSPEFLATKAQDPIKLIQNILKYANT